MDKNEIKESLTIEQIADIVAELGGEPQPQGDNILVCKTICHGGERHKLYYYQNSQLFKCYTDCAGDAFDILDLVKKVKAVTGIKWSLSHCINYVAAYFGIPLDSHIQNEEIILPDWKVLKKYQKEEEGHHTYTNNSEFKVYDKSVLAHYPQPRIIPWEKDGISNKVIKSWGIRYDPENHGVIIPHYDINDNLIGIRERTLVKEEEQYGKYKPAILRGMMYNHPLGFNLYGINKNKANIQSIGKAIVLEGEKSVLLYSSFFGDENNIAVACCGSNLVSHQVALLLSLGVKEIIVALDKQFKEIGDKEWKKLTENLTNIHNKYGAYTQISYMFDLNGVLPYKAAPIDCGKDIFLKLFKERVTIE
jgi:hypothetical protein